MPRLLRILCEEKDTQFNAVCWSPDGSSLAVGGDNGGVTVLAREGRRLWRNSEARRVQDLAWSSDGQRIASAGSELLLLKATTGEVDFSCQDLDSFRVSYSPTGREVVFGARGSLGIVDTATGQRIAQLAVESGWVSVSWSPDGSRIAYGETSGNLHIWNRETGEVTAWSSPHRGLVCDISWSLDGRRCASASHDGNCAVWDTESGSCLFVCRGHGSDVHSVNWSPNGLLLVSGSSDGTVRVWSAETGEEQHRLDGHRNEVLCVAYSPDGTCLASASQDGTVRLWDVSDLGGHAKQPVGAELNTYLIRQAATLGRRPIPIGANRSSWVPNLPADDTPGCLGHITVGGEHPPSLALSFDGTRLFVGAKGRFSCWNLRNGTNHWEVGEFQEYECLDISLSPTEDRLAAASSDTTLSVFDAINGKRLVECIGHTTSIIGVDWSPDGTRLISTAEKAADNMRLWDVNTGECLRTWAGHSSTHDAAGIRWSPDDRFVASSGEDQMLRVWDSTTWEEVRCFSDSQATIFLLCWSPDGMQIAAGCEDKQVRIWNIKEGLQVSFTGLSSEVFSVAWSPDGRFLASTGNSEDNAVRVWRVASAKEIARFEAKEDCAFCPCWGPKGAFLVSGHMGGIVRFWDLRELLSDSVAAEGFGPSPKKPLAAEFQRLPTAQARLHGLDIHAPVSLVRDLLELTRGRNVVGPAGQVAIPPAATARLRELVQLHWPDDARLGLVALLLHKLPLDGRWKPPQDIPLTRLRDALAEALNGEEIAAELPPIPQALLTQAFESIDDRLLALLALLGPEAVGADPALPIRLLPRVPDLLPLAASQRRLLGLRVRFAGRQGHATGRATDADRAQVGGVEMGSLGLCRGFADLLPSQWALPEDVLLYRQLRGELMFRAREVAEPPRLRPTVIVLDTTPPVFGAVEALTRLAAHAVAMSLYRAGLPAILVTTGGGLEGRDRIVELRQPSDLVEVWTQRTLEPPDAPRILRLAGALRTSLRDGSGLEPIVLVLSHPWFCADDPLPRVEYLRGLFVQYPHFDVEPALTKICQRSHVLTASDVSRLGEILGELVK